MMQISLFYDLSINCEYFLNFLIIYSVQDQLIILITLTCMPKSISQQYKQKCYLLVDFLESLSKKEASKCNKYSQKMDQSVANYARTCIHNLSIIDSLNKQRNESLDMIKQLKQQNKKLNEDVQRLSRVKGYKLNQNQKQINDMLSIIDLLKKGMYTEASRTSRKPFPFIQQLIQYDSLKSMYLSFKTHKKMQEKSISGSDQYRDLKGILFKQASLFQSLTDEVQFYLQKIDGASNQEQWPQPKHARDFTFLQFKNIQFKLRSLRNQNRYLQEIINQNPSELQSDNELLAKSTTIESAMNKQYRQLEYRIREIHKNFTKNSKQTLINKTSFECLNEIDDKIKEIIKINEVLHQKGNINEDQVQTKITIMSLEERVKQLQKIYKKIVDKLLQCIRYVNFSLKQRFYVQIKDINDEDMILRQLQEAIKDIMEKVGRSGQKNETLIKQRDMYKIQFNKMKLVQNISEQFSENIERLTIRRSSEEPSVEELAIKIANLQLINLALQRERDELLKASKQDISTRQMSLRKSQQQIDRYMLESLQLQKLSLERQRDELKKSLNHKEAQVEQLKKLLKSKESEVSQMKSVIFTHKSQEDQLRSCLKSQRKKIQKLELQQSNQSLILSQQIKFDQLVFYGERQSRKSFDGGFLQNIRKASHSDNFQGKQITQLKGKITQLSSQSQMLKNEKKNIQNDLQTLTKEKTILLRKIQEQVTQNNELNKKLKNERDANELQSNQLDQLNQVLDELQIYAKQLQKQKDQYKGPISQKSTLIQQRVTIQNEVKRGQVCGKCLEISNEINILREKMNKNDTQIKKRQQRIKNLEQFNLNNMKESQKISKVNFELNSKYEACKEALIKVQNQLFAIKQQPQKSQTHNTQLMQKLYRIQKINSTLKAQNDQLKITISLNNEINRTLELTKNTINTTTFLSNRPHLFTAKGVFEQNEQPYRQFLIQTLESEVGAIYQTKFLYSFDSFSKVNFHRYIDDHKHLVIIIKTIYGKLLAAYSQSQVSINGTYRGNGLLIPLWSMYNKKTVFHILQNKKPITYDDYFLIFGNSQVRIKSQQNKVFSNFGIANGFFNNEKQKVQQLLGEPERQIEIQTYEIYSVVFEGDRF